MLKVMIILCVIALLPTIGMARVVGRSVAYNLNGKDYEGYLAYDDAQAGKRPGVVVFPEWWGLTDYVKKRANMLAELGYVAFATDMYGKGVVTNDQKEAGKLMTAVRGGSAWREQAAKGLAMLVADEHCDPNRVAAIGYCVGGSTAFELAYSGAKIVGVVSFHGGPGVPKQEDLGRIHARLALLTGADDPMIPMADLEKFEKVVKPAKVDYQIIIYSGAQHAFTNPGADKHNIPGIKYNAAADRRSWEHMRVFFHEVFGEKNADTR